MTGTHAPLPRFITPATPGARNQGREIARLARALGKPLMPWQRLVVDRATELTPDGLYRYSTVLVTVPRQSGKTTLVGPVQLHRIMTVPNARAFFTAQTGLDAGKRMLDLIELVQTSGLAPLFKPRYAGGSQGLSTANRSALRVFAPGPSALHGETPHLVTLDEIWKHNAVAGAQLMGAIGPAQATLEGIAQLWMISTMGTAESEFMNALVEKGRETATRAPGAPGTMFYAEWSMEDGADPYSPRSWQFHPALYNTIQESALASQSIDLPMGEWMRAYMNRLTESADPLFTREEWQAMEVMPAEVPSRRNVWISYEVGREAEDFVVMANWRDSEGHPCSRLLHTAPGVVWAADYVEKLAKEWGAPVCADDGGETRSVTDDLERRGVEVVKVGLSNFATATVSWLTETQSRQLRHDGSAASYAAVARAVKEPMSDSWRFSRKRSPGSIAWIIASVVGLWCVDHEEPPKPKPRMFVI
jgi:hypothetical protein